MTRTKSINLSASAAVIPLLGLTIAACGGGAAATASPPASASTSPPKTSSRAPATVRVANRSLGSILVDAEGRTLYLWEADTGSQSTCDAACTMAWPPLLTTGAPTGGSGVEAPLLGTTKRADGTEQVTYNRHPLYRFTGDTKAGQTNGQGSTGFGAPWYTLSPVGNQLTGSAGAGGSSSSTGY